jgi:hypothetical protein
MLAWLAVEGVGFPRLNSRDQTQGQGPIRLLPVWFGMILWFMANNLLMDFSGLKDSLLFSCFQLSTYMQKGKSYLFYKKRISPLG